MKASVLGNQVSKVRETAAGPFTTMLNIANHMGTSAFVLSI
jgi:hypothetical protein